MRTLKRRDLFGGARVVYSSSWQEPTPNWIHTVFESKSLIAGLLVKQPLTGDGAGDGLVTGVLDRNPHQ